MIADVVLRIDIVIRLGSPFLKSLSIPSSTLPFTITAEGEATGTITSFNGHSIPSMSDYGLYGNPYLNTIDLHSCTSIGSYAFHSLPLNWLDISSCTTFGTDPFIYISGCTITIIIPHALESNTNIVNLKANNTVTVIYSD